MQGRVVEYQRLQGCECPLMQGGIGRRPPHEKVGQDDQEPGKDRQDSADGPHGPARSLLASRSRPRYSPVSVRKKATISSISAAGMVRPSWLRPMMATACSSVAALPSWK